jgi:CubicO group peptidase (beta-lactamase class C family)
VNAKLVAGHVAPGFQRVARAFAHNFDAGFETGAAFCLYRDGKPVVDVWSGMADPAIGRAWLENTLALVFSTTKGVTALCVLHLVEHGRIDLDQPVAHYWPGFAHNGKQAVTVRMVLSHRAGVPTIGAPLSLADVLEREPVLAAIEKEPPAWAPGTQHGYHGHTYGWILGELVRRVTGTTLGVYLRDIVAGPLDADVWIGLPEREASRVAPLIEPPPPPGVAPAAAEAIMRMVTLNGALAGSGADFPWNNRSVQSCEMPAVNGIATETFKRRIEIGLTSHGGRGCCRTGYRVKGEA